MLETADSHDRHRVKSLQSVQRTVSDGAYIRDPRAEMENLTVGDHSLEPALIYVFVLVLVMLKVQLGLSLSPLSGILMDFNG